MIRWHPLLYVRVTCEGQGGRRGTWTGRGLGGVRFTPLKIWLWKIENTYVNRQVPSSKYQKPVDNSPATPHLHPMGEASFDAWTNGHTDHTILWVWAIVLIVYFVSKALKDA